MFLLLFYLECNILFLGLVAEVVRELEEYMQQDEDKGDATSALANDLQHVPLDYCRISTDDMVFSSSIFTLS